MGDVVAPNQDIESAPVPSREQQVGEGGKKSLRGHMASERQTRDAEGFASCSRDRDVEGVEGVGNGEGYPRNTSLTD